MPGRCSLLTVAASLALLCGCGHTERVSGDGALQVAVSEFRVMPQSVLARAGTLILVVHNYGRLTHDLVISLSGRPEGATGPIAPGRTAELLVSLPVGRYLMASTLLSDQALGAYGTLTVI